MKKQVEVKSERDVNTYAEFWHTSYCLIEMTNKVEEGSHHLIMSSLVFTSFAIEAYLNHVGSKFFASWNDLENLNPKKKLNVISEKIGLKVNYGIRPWKLMTELFKFRNDIAHGKTQKLEITKIESLDTFNSTMNTFNGYRVVTSWEKYCTKENALRAREEVEAIVKAIHSSANISTEYPFQFGLESIGGTLQQN